MKNLSLEKKMISLYKTSMFGQRIGNRLIKSSQFDKPGLVRMLYRKKIEHDIKKYEKKPDIVKVESTNLCNANCRHCPQPKLTRERGFMSFDLFNNIADQCAQLGIKNLQVSYFGEPILDKRILDKIRYAKKLHIPNVRFYTNGALLTPHMCAQLVESGVDVINISVDGLDAQSYEYWRKPLSYNILLANIDTLMAIRRNAQSSTPKVVVNHVNINETESQTAAFLRFWQEKVDEVKIHIEHNWGGHLKDSVGIRKRPCSVLWYQMIVLWNGKAGLCCQDALGTITLGDLTKQTLAQAWQNPARQRIRDLHLSYNFKQTGICHTCNFVSNWL